MSESSKATGASAMVERVALALYKDRYPHRAVYYDGEASRLEFEGHARAAIEAMREPTVEMVRGATIDPLGKYVTPNHSALCWQAMIDEALK